MDIVPAGGEDRYSDGQAVSRANDGLRSLCGKEQWMDAMEEGLEEAQQ